MLFLVSGTVHLVRPSVFHTLVPGSPAVRDPIILFSGVAELACAVGLLARARWAGRASAALLVAVFPGNVVYAIRTARRPDASGLHVALAWLRLPLQAPLIWAALQSGRSRDAGADARI